MRWGLSVFNEILKVLSAGQYGFLERDKKVTCHYLNAALGTKAWMMLCPMELHYQDVGRRLLNGPSWNTDQGVQHVCESVGFKPMRRK